MTAPAVPANLPQMGSELFVTDGGIETTLIFHEGLDLPYFAAFDLLRTIKGTDALRRYYARYTEVAAEHGLGFVLESATWRASPDWGRRLGYDARGLQVINRDAVALLRDVRDDTPAGVRAWPEGCAQTRRR
jgi:S-methylmethionine-dependent homocysteine/selenocysteine methylase